MLNKLHALLKKRPESDAGLVISERALALVQRKRSPVTGAYNVVFAKQRECDTLTQRKIVLQQWIDTCGLHNSPVNLILPHNAFNLVQLDRPNVSDTEINSAIRWRLRDSVDYPVSEAIVDTFAVPEGRQTGHSRIYVVCVPQIRLKEYVNLLQDVGFNARNISVAPLAMRNLAQYALNAQETIGFVHITQEDAALYICRGEVFYLSRTLNISQAQLATEDTSEQTILSAQLVLDIQRTMDYYDTYFGHASVSQLWFETSPQNPIWLTDQVEMTLGIPCSWLMRQLKTDIDGVVVWGDLLPLALGGIMETG